MFALGAAVWVFGGIGFPAWYIFAGGPAWCGLAAVGCLIVGVCLIAAER